MTAKVKVEVLVKRFHIKTYGCQMNERDSEAAASALLAAGFEMASSESEADVLLFNTCSVRDQAERKAIGKIGLVKRGKRVRPDLVVGVLGCMAQSLGEELFEKIPHVDFVLGTDRLGDLVEVLNAAIARRVKVSRTDAAGDVEASRLSGHLPLDRRSSQVSAFVSLMRGCDRFCSYCIVPYVRGRECSRPVGEVLDEVSRLVCEGVKEIVFLGQNVAAYGKKESGGVSWLPELFERANDISGLRRIRFTSPHPADFDDALIEAVAVVPKVCDNVHLPLQSGSDRVLAAMNRNYSSAEYFSVVEKLKRLSGGLTFSTDVIVGFPGETDDDFRATRTLMEEVGFDNAFIFKYSPRRGTRAASFADSVPLESKEERNAVLLADLKRRAESANSSLVGERVETLVEGVSRRNASRWFGRSRTNKMVVFDPDPSILVGDVVSPVVERSTAATLFGAFPSEE